MSLATLILTNELVFTGSSRNKLLNIILSEPKLSDHVFRICAE